MIKLEVWVELCVKGHADVFLLMRYEGFTICADGSVSNWLSEWNLKGWQIKAVGIMTDYIQIEIE